MTTTQDVELALNLLREQVQDKTLEPKDRQMAAKAVLMYHGTGKTKEKRDSSAIAAANRFQRVK